MLAVQSAARVVSIVGHYWLAGGVYWALSQTSACLLTQSDVPPFWQVPPDLAFPSRAAGGASRRPTRVLSHFLNYLR